MSAQEREAYPLWQYSILALFLSISVITLLFNAWTSDDAFFTFRVVDNVIDGYGLRFNVQDRVQIYTNPLWMLVHLPFRLMFDNIAYITIGISFACALASIWLVLRALNLPPLLASVFFLLPFSLSKTIPEFFSSGLENPMTSLMFAWFFYEIMTHKSPRWFWLVLIVSLSMVNRMDTLLAYIPILGYLAIKQRFRLPYGQIVAGGLPIIGWLCFSLLYYGFLFPNTKYAKLDTGLPAIQYINFGAHYVLEFIMADPLSAGLIFLVLWQTFFIFKKQNQWNLFFLGLGMALYSLYVIRVGGSYISCLFMSLPAFMGLTLFAASLPNWLTKSSIYGLILTGIAMLATDALASNSLWEKQRTKISRQYQISNFKPEYLLSFDEKTFRISMNKYIKKFNACPAEFPVNITFGRGGRGSYYDGPCRYQMGRYALGDSLLAHMPTPIPKIGRISHIPRSLPAGYLHALETDSLEQMDPSLAEYLKPLMLLSRGKIFDPERLKAIVLFNLGAYDHYKEEYLSRQVPVCDPVCNRRPTGWPEAEMPKNKKKNRQPAPEEDHLDEEIEGEL